MHLFRTLEYLHTVPQLHSKKIPQTLKQKKQKALKSFKMYIQLHK